MLCSICSQKILSYFKPSSKFYSLWGINTAILATTNFITSKWLVDDRSPSEFIPNISYAIASPWRFVVSCSKATIIGCPLFLYPSLVIRGSLSMSNSDPKYMFPPFYYKSCQNSKYYEYVFFSRKQ